MALVVGIFLALFVVDGAWDYVVIAVGGAIEVVEAGFWWRWTHGRRPAVGVETLLGRTVEVDEDGWARVAGERWRVRGAEPRESARVVGVDGLTLLVEREDARLRQQD
jgi:membrane protein implicated in regulation of membrane protease activity